jgi:hypothetical protein
VTISFSNNILHHGVSKYPSIYLEGLRNTKKEGQQSIEERGKFVGRKKVKKEGKKGKK